MGDSLRIEFDGPITDERVHDFRNFGEDVYSALKDTCTMSMNEIDSAENCFGVWDIPDHALPEVRRTIERLLREYGFQDSAQLVAVAGPGPYGGTA